jgi:hypothetical protein
VVCKEKGIAKVLPLLEGAVSVTKPVGTPPISFVRRFENGQALAEKSVSQGTTRHPDKQEGAKHREAIEFSPSGGGQKITGSSFISTHGGIQ